MPPSQRRIAFTVASADAGREQAQAQAGERVVGLKPGDAFRQAPHAQLATQLAAAGIACDVVAGVTAD